MTIVILNIYGDLLFYLPAGKSEIIQLSVQKCRLTTKLEEKLQSDFLLAG